MPGRRNYTTLHVCISLNNPCCNVPSDHDQIARQGLQSKLDSFQAEFHGPVFLAVGPDAKLDMYNNFDQSKPFAFNVDPPSTENLPVCRIIQEGKDPILTADFYFTNVEPKPWILPTLPEKKDTPTESGAAAATNNFTPIIEADPQQPGEICMHSWMLYTSQAPVLDLHYTRVTYVLDLQTVFHSLHLCSEEDNTHPAQCPNGCK